MIDKIKYQLWGESLNPSHRDQAEALLNVIEREGMLPPEQNGCGCGGYHECYEWEKE